MEAAGTMGGRTTGRIMNIIALVAILSLSIPWQAFAATIQTDLWIYQTGDTVKVTGDGFQAGEDVVLVTTDPTSAEVDRGTTAADGAGNIAYSFVLNSDVPGIYDVNATGTSSGLTAHTQFDPAGFSSSGNNWDPAATAVNWSVDSLVSNQCYRTRLTKPDGSLFSATNLYTGVTTKSGAFDIAGSVTVGTWTLRLDRDSSCNGSFNNLDIATKSIAVSNRPPTAGTATISPNPARTGSSLTATYSGFSDPDGQTLTYSYQWFRNGAFVTGQTTSAYSGTQVKGDTIKIVVTAKDPFNATASAEDSLVIQNTAPVAGTVTISPSSPIASSSLTTTRTNWTDADGDSIAYSYNWFRNDSTVSGQTSSSYTGTQTKGDVIKVVLTGSDGTASSSAFHQVTIGNASPTVGKTNASASANEGSTAANTGTWSDADSDAVTLTASAGTVTKNADGTWSWSFDATDGPAQSQTVTITATDSTSATSTVTFPLTVSNVAPSVTAPADQTAIALESKAFNLGSFSDVSGDGAWGVDVDWGDSSTHTTFTTSAAGDPGTKSHTYAGLGTYTVTVKVTDKDGGYASKTFTVAVSTIDTDMSVTAASGTYGGATNLSAKLTTLPGVGLSGKTVSFKLNGTAVGTATTNADGVATVTGVSLTGINAGTYTPASSSDQTKGVYASFAGDTTHTSSQNTAALTVGKATAQVTLGSLQQTYDGSVKNATATTDPAGLNVNFAYSQNGTEVASPTNAGSYSVTATVSDANYQGSATGTLVISPAAATITLDSATLSQTYNGAARVVTATTSPSGLSYSVTYDGSATAPTNAGSYAVVAHITNPNYSATDATGTLAVSKATPVITWSDPSEITYGTALSATQLNATANVPGSFVYTPASGTVLGAGSNQLLSVAFTPADGANYNSASKTVNINVLKKALTVTADDKSMTYGGTRPAFTVSYSGFITGENEDNLGGALSFSGAATTAVNAGSYAIVPSGLTSSNYAITFVNGTLTISARAVTVKTRDASKEYGDANPTFAIELASGTLASGDTLGELGAPVFSFTDPTNPVNAGQYPINVSGLDNSNYAISYATGTDRGVFTINKATLTVTADNKTREYGDANPEFTASYSGFKNSETLATSGVTGSPSLTTTATQASSVDDYTITAAGGTLAADNYSFSFVNGTLSVTKAPLSVTPDNKTREYGLANPTLTGTITGIKNSDAITASYSTSATQTSPVGDYDITASLSGDKLSNYDVTSNTGKLSITKATLTVTAVDESKVYGEANPSFTYTMSGFRNSETEAGLRTAGALSGQPSLSTTATTTSSVVGSPYTITAAQGTLSATNYSFRTVNGTLTVDKANTSTSAADKSATYSPAAQNVTLTAGVIAQSPSTVAVDQGKVTFTVKSSSGGVIGAATESAELTDGSASVSYSLPAGTAAGTYTIHASYSGGSNFQLSEASGTSLGTLTVNKANQTITFGAISDRTYGDAAFAPGATASSGLAVSYSVTGNCEVTTDGKIAITGAGSCEVTASQAGNGNYNAATSVSQSFSIAKAQATITLSNLSGHTYNGAGQTATATATATRPEASNLGTITIVYKQGDTVVASPTNAGSYSVTATLDNANYQADPATGTLVIAKKDLDVSADNKSKVYGEANPNLTYSFDNSDFAGTDTAADSVSGQPTLSTSADAGSPVGSYTITIEAGSMTSANYNLVLHNGTLTVDKANTTITGANKSSTYGDSSVILTASVSANSPSGATVNSGNVTFEVKSADGTSSYGSVTGAVSGGQASATYNPSALTAGSYKIVATYSGTSNFNGDSDSSNTLTVNKRPITVTADAKSKTYGDADPALTYSVTSGTLVNGDSFSGSLTRAAGESVAGSPYAITQGTLSAGSNYDLTYVGASLTINKAILTVTADNKTKVLGSVNPTLTYTISGFKNGETLATSGVTGSAACSTTATTSSPVGAYDIVCTQGTLDSGNYSFTFAKGTLTIIYRWDGFLQPINDTAHEIGTSTSIFKAGSTIPVKFQLKDVNGNVVQSATAPKWIGYAQGSPTTGAVDETAYPAVATTGLDYRWDGTQYIYNWSTKGLKAGYYYRIGVQLEDGRIYYVNIGLR